MDKLRIKSLTMKLMKEHEVFLFKPYMVNIISEICDNLWKFVVKTNPFLKKRTKFYPAEASAKTGKPNFYLSEALAVRSEICLLLDKKRDYPY